MHNIKDGRRAVELVSIRYNIILILIIIIIIIFAVNRERHGELTGSLKRDIGSYDDENCIIYYYILCVCVCVYYYYYNIYKATNIMRPSGRPAT